MLRIFKKLLPFDAQVRSIVLALNVNSFANSLISVFVPLIIYRSSGSLGQVAHFYLVYALIKLCLNFGAMRFIQRFGASHGLYLGFICGALQLALIQLYSIRPQAAWLALAATCLALSNALCWNAQHLYLSRSLAAATMSRSLASMEMIARVLCALGPILGALIAELLGSGILIGFAATLILLTLIPLRAMRAFEQQNPQPKVVLCYSLKGAPGRDILANFFFNIESAVGHMLWPVYLAVAVSSYQSIGVISTVGMLVALVAIRIAGQLGDRGKSRKVLGQGAALVACSHLYRLLVSSPIGICTAAAAYQCAAGYMFNSWLRLYYQHSSKKGINYIVSLEIGCDLAYLCLWSLFALLIGTLGVSLGFDLLFVFAALSAFGPLLISKEQEGPASS